MCSPPRPRQFPVKRILIAHVDRNGWVPRTNRKTDTVRGFGTFDIRVNVDAGHVNMDSGLSMSHAP